MRFFLLLLALFALASAADVDNKITSSMEAINTTPQENVDCETACQSFLTCLKGCIDGSHSGCSLTRGCKCVITFTSPA